MLEINNKASIFYFFFWIPAYSHYSSRSYHKHNFKLLNVKFNSGKGHYDSGESMIQALL